MRLEIVRAKHDGRMCYEVTKQKDMGKWFDFSFQTRIVHIPSSHPLHI